MKKPSLSKRIAEYLEKKACWINSGELERLALQAGYKSSNAGRRCREMTTGKSSNGSAIPILLERKEVNGIVWYKHIDVPQLPKVHMVEKEGIMYQLT